MKKRMNICFHISKQYLHYTYIPIKSILVNNAEYELFFYLLSNTISKDDLDEFLILANQYDAHVIIISDPELVQYEDDRAMHEHMLFNRMLFRFPEDIDRIMVLDADILVLKSLGTLYESDFENNYVICSNADCVNSDKVNNWNQYFTELGVKGYSAVCALYNLSKIRKELSLDMILKMHESVFERYGFYHAELTLALAFNNKIMHFSERKYGLYLNSYIENTVSKEELTRYIDEAVLIHYFRALPWNPGINLSVLTLKWWEYAKGTPFYEEYVSEFWDSYKIRRKEEINALALKLSFLDDFEYHFKDHKKKKIVLYGTSDKTKIICEEMDQYNIVGIMDKNDLNIGKKISEVDVIDINRANKSDVIIIVTVEKHWKEIYNRIKDKINSQIEVYGLSGENLREKYK